MLANGGTGALTQLTLTAELGVVDLGSAIAIGTSCVESLNLLKSCL